jgi:hypothetical protein
MFSIPLQFNLFTRPSFVFLLQLQSIAVTYFSVVHVLEFTNKSFANAMA